MPACFNSFSNKSLNAGKSSVWAFINVAKMDKSMSDRKIARSIFMMCIDWSETSGETEN